jgi:2-methylcitrate dehydratase PrpD
MDAAVAFAKSMLSLRYEDIPAKTTDITKKIILDALGVSIAGSSALGTEAVIELAREWGGKKESTIIASAYRVPTISAALANGAMIRSRDYNETFDAGMTHPSVPVIPAAFAIAEKVGKVNGKEFITAVTAAMDIHCRMALASVETTLSRWLPPQLNGFLAAAAVAGRLLGLTEEQMISAFGLAYAQTSGAWQSTTELVLARGLQGAFSSSSGVLAALMASKGITGARNSLEGEQGLYNLYHQGNYNREILVADLGKKFDSINNISFKPYPCCRQAHPFIDAALHIVREHEIQPDQIDKVTVFVREHGQSLCEPLDKCQSPSTITEAQRSIPYTTAVAIVKKNVVLSDFSENGFRNPEVLKIAHKVTPKFDPRLEKKGIEGGIVEIITANGKKVYSKRVDFPKGDPQKPFTMEEHIAKFKDCALWAAKPIPAEKVNHAIEILNNLEHSQDVEQVIRLVAGE